MIAMPRAERLSALAVTIATASLLLAPAALAKGPRAELVSRASGADGEPANGLCGAPDVSADGRYVVFASEATNLDPADTSPRADIYLRDTKTDTTTLVSRASGPDGEKADDAAIQPSISADGRYVAFVTDATNLAGLTTGYTQVYVRDLATQTTTLVSRASGPGGEPADSLSAQPSISAGGRYVAFMSQGENLHPPDGMSTFEEVYVRDLVAETTTLVSRRDGPSGLRAADASHWPSISADGTHVAFVSYSPFLAPGIGTTSYEFVRDVPEGTTTLVSRASGRKGRRAEVDSPTSISGDGNTVPFGANRAVMGTGPDDDSGSDVFVREVDTSRTRLVSRGFGKVQSESRHETTQEFISANGRFVSFALGKPSLDRARRSGPQGLYLRDLKKKDAVQLISARDAGTPEVLDSSLSRDGEEIAFASDSAKLNRADRDRDIDVFRLRTGSWLREHR